MEVKVSNVNESIKIQDKSSNAWLKLCEYIDSLVEDGSELFQPFQYLSEEEYLELVTLSKSIQTFQKKR